MSQKKTKINNQININAPSFSGIAVNETMAENKFKK